MNKLSTLIFVFCALIILQAILQIAITGQATGTVRLYVDSNVTPTPTPQPGGGSQTAKMASIAQQMQKQQQQPEAPPKPASPEDIISEQDTLRKVSERTQKSTETEKTETETEEELKQKTKQAQTETPSKLTQELSNIVKEVESDKNMMFGAITLTIQVILLAFLVITFVKVKRAKTITTSKSKQSKTIKKGSTPKITIKKSKSQP